MNEASGNIYISDEANGRVERFGAEGEYLGEFDGSGTFVVGTETRSGLESPTGKFLKPRMIAVDNSCIQLRLTETQCQQQDPSRSDVYVVDFEHEVIDKFTELGEYLGQLKIPSVEGAPALILAGIAVDTHGNVWVAEEQGFEHKGFDEFDDASSNGNPRFVRQTVERFVTQLVSGGAGVGGLSLGRDASLFADLLFEAPFGAVITSFSPTGEFLGVLQTAPSTGIGTESTTGDVYVDNVTSVGRLTPTAPSSQVERFGEGHLTEGSGVAVNSTIVTGTPDREGPVYVADAGAADIVAFLLEGPKPPTIEGPSVASVTSTSASLQAAVNPRGARSEYRFEYGVCSTSSTCGSSSFEVSTSEPSEGIIGGPLDFENHIVKLHPQDLGASTSYHFRVAARNEKTLPGEFIYGPEVIFHTQSSEPVAPLLDGRNWEIVSPPHKHGTQIRAIQGEDVIQAAQSGESLTYETAIPSEDEPLGFSNFVQVLARRRGSGWASEDLGLPHSRATGHSVGEGQEYRLFSQDLSLGLVQPFGQFEPTTSPEATEQTPYIRTEFRNGSIESPCTSNCYTPLVTAANVPEGSAFGEEGLCPPRLKCGPLIVGASVDAKHVILKSAVALTEIGKGGLYEWSNGSPSLVSMLPTNQPATLSSGPVLGNGRVTRGAVSADGSRVVWTGNLGASLFLRDTVRNETVEVNKGLAGTPEFQVANADASRVFFTDGGDLYVYEVAKDAAIRLTTPIEAKERSNVQGQLAGISEDGSSVYFVANGRFSEEAESGEGTCHGASSSEANRCYLYGVHASASEETWGTPHVVAVLSGSDAPDFSEHLPKLTIKVSPNGQWLTFMSQLPLTGYDNRDAVSGIKDEELFLYDDAANSLICVSCDPSGARPTGVEYGQLQGGLVAGDRVWPPEAWLAANVPGWTPNEVGSSFYQSRYVLNDGRVFFNSSDALVPGDVNGTEDVYEYEPTGIGTCTTTSRSFVGSSNGCVGLVSSGTSGQESGFLDASASGSDVFFLTTSRLASADFDTALDVYDAHECTSTSPCLPEISARQQTCNTEASCKQSPSLQPEIFGAPASAMFNGIGNVSAPATDATKPLTRHAMLVKAMMTCRHQHSRSKKRRKACERHARGSFAALRPRQNARK